MFLKCVFARLNLHLEPAEGRIRVKDPTVPDKDDLTFMAESRGGAVYALICPPADAPEPSEPSRIFQEADFYF